MKFIYLVGKCYDDFSEGGFAIELVANSKEFAEEYCKKQLLKKKRHLDWIKVPIECMFDFDAIPFNED